MEKTSLGRLSPGTFLWWCSMLQSKRQSVLAKFVDGEDFSAIAIIAVYATSFDNPVPINCMLALRIAS